MLLANYGSDSGSDSDSEAPIAPPPKPAPISAASSSSRVPHPKKKKPIKITLDLPKASNGSEDEKNIGDNHGVSGDERETKRAKLPKGGKGTSSLLGMLPPPKRKLPQSSTSATKGTGLTVNKSMGRPQLPAPPKAIDENSDDEDNVPKVRDMLPASLARKQQKVESKEEVIDVFGLKTASAPLPKPTIATPSLKPPSISSAPVAPDFIPPEPTTNDPYPGYYQLPSGEWRAYDPDYYHSFFRPSAPVSDKQDADDGRVGRHWDAFEKGQFQGQVLDIDANKGLAEARAEEERRALMKKPKLPGEEFVYQPKGQVKGLASQRHQLTSLLNTAYSQREELEERIAANKKGMRAAGTKYDICLYNYDFDSLSNSHPARSLMVLQTLFLTLATSATRSLASSNRSLYSLQSASSSEILSHASSTARH
ncbi:hypothetical protein C359_00087 [Cryptococcus neoformans Bt120]|nr:hypothetical protein C360_00519 [Cryptococcus neoformans var. grubii Bt15]OXG45405.1 hypothetical protein C359_00087 [Cryptococcus neoformans var. grubii Bt120]